MKKCLVVLFSVLVVGAANAVDMCVKNDSVVVVLDPILNATSNSSDAETYTWSATFSYGTIDGVAACFDGSDTSAGQIATVQTINVGPNTNSSSKCYCKMLHPVESLWVYTSSYSWAGHDAGSRCKSNCTAACATYMTSEFGFRTVMFGSIGQ